MKIYQCIEISAEVIIAFNELIPQLNEESKTPSKDYLDEIINSKNSYIFLAEEEKIVGTLTLIINQMPSGKKAWIEDVVVNSKMRGRGIGEKLIEFAVEFAKKHEISKIDLSSKPERIAANNLYKKLGFKQRETNVYRLKF
ncbi:MAG: GNAT family N-acetyltransferase [Prolixibacteraceae bacterium]|jgi:ribosomal protein S18 acetylase RimI-like enzyme|nr:GNAT family N-acetyltransferase [Prolixibacteraceae bacterium]MBT6007145.1 GNAT family N-acetyltransferase [Prolixibacteraceae bacterium]MBT6764661.1 GNAT family N-acetyltransferase [Prolixibacteraceae bacterium]MBT6998485.1 GNAT family N-acetyltransferase [Prolixibacteraceae bacterium]MBT7397126.1 GNAT family N-acetyltransferase [Prolixibacteraceae bacterium]